MMVCFPKGSSGRRLGIRSLLRIIVMEASIKIIAAQHDLRREGDPVYSWEVMSLLSNLAQVYHKIKEPSMGSLLGLL